MNILMVAAELWPLVKAGGLADAVAALSKALRRSGADVRVAVPRYREVERNLDGIQVRPALEGTLELPGGPERFALSWATGEALPCPALLVEHPCFQRPGVYDDPATGEGYPDNPGRWARLGRAVTAGLEAGVWSPEVVHGHDHQAAPTLARLRWVPGSADGARPGLVFTIHNLGYQGLASPAWVAEVGLPWDLYYPTGPLEFHGHVNLMKLGIVAADRITTVSPTYAREIVEDDSFGHGLRDVLASRRERLTGILNGVDTDVWDPAADPRIPFHYSRQNLSGKARNRRFLRGELDLEPDPRRPLLGMITRLTDQKGVDLMLEVAPVLARRGAQIVVLGSGERRYERALERLAQDLPGSMAVRLGYDETLAHRIEAAADIYVMPSRYEPCGLNQMYSMRYGTVPAVRAVGGLADTVVDLDEEPDDATGFVFRLYQPVELFKTVHRALRARRQRGVWRELVLRGMGRDFSWDRSAREYASVYEKSVEDAARTVS